MISSVNADGIDVRFGGLGVIHDVSINVGRGEIVGLVGPNGAGKTTLLNVLSGFVRPVNGTVHLDSTNVTRKLPHQISRIGVARTFQGGRLYGDLTVRENVMAGVRRAGRRKAQEKAASLLKQFGISHLSEVVASALPAGGARRVGILRALASSPDIVLLDEPAAGSDDTETRELALMLGEIRDQTGTGILVVEHDMNLIRQSCARIVVLDAGRVIAAGSPDEVLNSEAVRAAYLGTATPGQTRRRSAGA